MGRAFAECIEAQDVAKELVVNIDTGAPAGTRLLIQNVTVLPMTSNEQLVLENHCILIEYDDAPGVAQRWWKE